MNWLNYFISIAEVVKLKSKDEHTQIGVAVVGPDNEIRSTGYNSFPRGINDRVAVRQQRPLKYFYFAHAERNALYNAARVGTPLKDCVMYLTCGVPCADCAIGIINSGIKEIWVNWAKNETNSEKWAEHAKHSMIMFEEAGVTVRWWRYDENKVAIQII